MADHYDNAPTESWFATLKRELVYRTSYATHAEARQNIFEYIEVWYNRKRKHSTIGYMSPELTKNNGRNQPLKLLN